MECIFRTSTFKHFDGVHIPVIPGRERVDVLIGQSDKSLLTVFEEREGVDPEEPNYVLTRLGPIASGGRVAGNRNLNSLTALRVILESPAEEVCGCEKLKSENALLKQAIRKYELHDEAVEPSRNDDLALELTEPTLKLLTGGTKYRCL